MANFNSTLSPPPITTWIYHERQDALLCGQHSLNNLVQSQAFGASDLANIAQQLDAMELNFMSENNEGGVHSRDFIRRLAEGSGNVDNSGNFSIEVLRSALLNQYGLTLTNVRHEGVRKKEITELDGFICHRDDHWFTIRKINERFWNLNSTVERPELISHFRLAAELDALQTSGYSVFCVMEIGKLPPVCNSDAERDERGLLQFWWNEADLMRGGGKNSVSNATNDPWKDVGSGMRLDGRSTTANSSHSNNTISIDGLTEEEMLQMAICESQMSNNNSSAENHTAAAPAIADVAVTPEPPSTEENAVRLRFRLPDARVVMRRFLKSDLVDVLYTFVGESCPTQGGMELEMKAGYPLKDVRALCGGTIEDASLSGEMIRCRHI